MQSTPSLWELHSRLDSLPLPDGDSVTQQDQINVLEEYCIQLLDGSWEQYAPSDAEQYVPGVLQEFLETYLYLRRLELGLIEFPDPNET